MKKYILILLAVCLIGCEDNTATGTGNNKTNVTITKVVVDNELYYEDFDYMIKTLEHTYPFFGVLDRSGIDFDEITSRYRSQLEDRQMTDIRFYHLIDTMLGELKYTGHIHVVDKNNYGYYENTNMLPWSDAANTDQTKAFYETLVTPPFSNNNSEESANINTQAYDDISTVYIGINSFSYELIEEDYKTLTDYYKIAKHYDNIVIDVRNNGGGSTNYYIENIVQPLMSNEMRYMTHMLFNKDDHNLPFITHKLGGNQRLISDIKDLDLSQFPNFNTDDLEYLSHVIINNQIISPTGDGYKGNIYVLVGPRNYSSSEAFINYCKVTGFATLVGHQTGGDGIGFDPIVLSMPNSGIMVAYSTIYGMDHSGQNSEEFGTTPDILLDENINAYEYLMNRVKDGSL